MHDNLDIYHEKIFYFKKIILHPEKLIHDIEESDNYISSLDAITKWEDWKSSNDDYQFGKTKKVYIDRYETSSEKIKSIFDRIEKSLNKSYEIYSNFNKIKNLLMTPFSISKYYEGKRMGPHDDSRSGAMLSAVAYLNDDYEGGELNFPSHNLSIKPEAGSIIFFPSTDGFIHDPQAANGSERYIVPAFWIKNNIS